MKKKLPLYQSWRMIDTKHYTISVLEDDFEFIKKKMKEEKLPIISQETFEKLGLLSISNKSTLRKYKIAHVVDVVDNEVVLSNEIDDKYRYVIPIYLSDKEHIEPLQHVSTFGVFQVLGGIAMYEDLKLH